MSYCRRAARSPPIADDRRDAEHWLRHVPQRRRNHVLTGLRTRDLRVLLATDVAARGLDVPTISHVINYGMPLKAEDYVHRIGRTGRAGRSGTAYTLVTPEDVNLIDAIENLIKKKIERETLKDLPEPQSHMKHQRHSAHHRGSVAMRLRVVGA